MIQIWVDVEYMYIFFYRFDIAYICVQWRQNSNASPHSFKETVSFPQYNFAGYQMCYPKKTGNLSSPPFALIPIFAA